MRKEQWFEDDGKIIRQKTTDPTAALESAKELRLNYENTFAEDIRHIGRIDMHVLEMWLKEAGVALSDRAAVSEVIKRKMASNEFAGFRVAGGTL